MYVYVCACMTCTHLTCNLTKLKQVNSWKKEAPKLNVTNDMGGKYQQNGGEDFFRQQSERILINYSQKLLVRENSKLRRVMLYFVGVLYKKPYQGGE